MSNLTFYHSHSQETFQESSKYFKDLKGIKRV